MKNKFLPVLLLCFCAIIFSACTNILGEDKKSSDSKGIVLSLPYAKSNKTGVFRAGEDAANSRPLNFKVTFTHKDSGTETPFEGKSGEKIIFENAPVGVYTISVQGFNKDNELEYEGYTETPVEVKEGETTTVVIKLKRVKSNDDNPINEEPEPVEINLLGWTDEQARMIEKYIDTHPDCGIKVIFKQVETTNGQYTSFLDEALTGKSDEFVPDIYSAESAFVKHYSSGAMGQYALPYTDLISGLSSKILSAQIAEYTVNLGKNSSGDVVGLAYQTTGGAFIYRRSVAKQVFGTDDPELVSNAIGGGSGSWNKFFEVAETCNDKGIAILSGDASLWHPVEGSAEKGWVVDGKLHIDSKREAFLDYSKNLYVNGWTNKTEEWSEDWKADIQGKGKKPVLGFFGPAWLINYSMEPACNKDDDGNVINNDTDWAICDAPVGFLWGGTWMFANKNLKADTSEEGKRKLEAIQKIIEWITLDTTEEGLQYQWANGLINNAKDTVASKVVMEESDGTLDFLNGQNMFDYFIPANEKAPSNLLTEYDEKINALWRFEVNKYAEGLTTREQALHNFKIAVYSELGLMSEDFESDGIAYETEHVRAEPDPDGKGIKFTLTCKEGESWNPGGSFIWETKNHYGIRITNVPTPGNPVVCYYPITEDKGAYSFDCELEIVSGNKITESLVMIANGGNESISIQADNFDISLSGGLMKLSKDTTFEITHSSNVKPYLDFIVETTDGVIGKDRFDIAWKEWLNSSHLEYSDEMISTLKNDGYTVLAITNDTYSKLQKNNYYFANLSVEFTIDGIPESFRTWVGMNSEVVEFDKTAFESDTSEHVHAEPDPDGKGIKFTISAKNGEEWKAENFNITELSTGLYMEIQNKIPEPGNPIVCYWPFTNDGDVYLFDCEVKLSGQNTIHESVSATANGNYAILNIDFASLSGLTIEVNSATGIAKVSKDVSLAITRSENVTATFDIGSFANDSATAYKWTHWLSSKFVSITDSDVYDNGKGISLFTRDKGTIQNFKNDEYFFTEMSLNFEISGIDERYRYSNGYRTSIMNASDFLSNLNTNDHISVEPCDEGVKVTLRRLETDGDWLEGNTLICLAEDWEDGVNLNLVRAEEFDEGIIPENQYGNRCPTAAEPEVTYIYPLTESGKEYGFLLAGPLDKENNWQSEYVCCTAGGGLGELIDYDIWNHDVKVTDIFTNATTNTYSYKIQGDIQSIIDNSTNKFSSAELWPDVRPGTEDNHREKTFGYSSRRVFLVGEADEYNRGLEALDSPFVIENSPAYDEGQLSEGDYDNENVYEILSNWNNQFYVIMSIQRIQLEDYPNMQFHLHWK